MQQGMYAISKVRELIQQGRRLLLAGDELALRQLPSGFWIGGTIPYFMTQTGGTSTKEQIYVSELPEYVESVQIKVYDKQMISGIYSDIPDGGYGFIIIPTASQIHFEFALNAPTYPEFAFRPLLGWIAGVHLDDLGSLSAKVCNGETLELTDSKAIAMLVTLSANKIPEIGILNIFEQGQGDTITVDQDSFVLSDVYINGIKQNFVDYLSENNIDTKLPLVANYFGASINVSFQAIDDQARQVTLYAPVFRDVEYKLARPFANYVTEFTSRIPEVEDSMVFSCNCILNYLYSDLENKQIDNMIGPITFGEIAYQLMNQTMAYLTIHDN